MFSKDDTNMSNLWQNKENSETFVDFFEIFVAPLINNNYWIKNNKILIISLPGNNDEN